LSRTGAPRLLQAIAADGVIPFINPFSVTNLKGEPRRALYLTATIAETGVLLANVDYIAPIITMYVRPPPSPLTAILAAWLLLPLVLFLSRIARIA